MNRYPVTLLLSLQILIIPGKILCQDDVIYRSAFIHPAILNPAITGSEFYTIAGLSYQKQWVGINGSPGSMLASASVRIGNFDFYNPQKLINTTHIRSRERIGLGLSLFSDRNGPALQRGFNLAYAYHLVLKDARLSLGLSGNIEQQMVDESIFTPFDPNDPILSYAKESYMKYNADVGAYYYSATLFGGLAFHHILPFRDPLRSGTTIRPDVILHGGYLFSTLARPKLELRMNARYLNLERLEMDLHIRSYIQQYHWLAVSVRSYKALAMHVGIRISTIHLAYTYEANLTDMVRYNMGSHAIHLGMNMGIRRTKGF
jgi:type IX secretion system PorP/SprF family membrane protein